MVAVDHARARPGALRHPLLRGARPCALAAATGRDGDDRGILGRARRGAGAPPRRRARPRLPDDQAPRVAASVFELRGGAGGGPWPGHRAGAPARGRPGRGSPGRASRRARVRRIVIAVQSLTKRYGRTVAVDGLSFEARPGSVLGFLGPNGAGKTTTLRIILGLAHPTSGGATIDGRPYRSLTDPTLSVGSVLDTSGFHPGRRARDHLRIIARASGIPVSRVDEVLKLVELSSAARTRAKAYSLGMR